MLRRYSAKPSPPDHRDFGVARLPRRDAPLPSSYSLEQWLGPVKNQGSLGACTAFASTGMLEFLLRKHDPEYTGDKAEFAPVLSPQYLYYRERQLDGTLADGDCGSYGRTACRALQQFGACLETEDPYQPYTPSIWNSSPSSEQDAEALTFRSGAYHRLTTVDDMKHCVASDYVFIVGFNVKESFESQNGTGKTHVYAPKPHEESLGGHEVLVHSFDDSKFGGSFKVRNSWGGAWADHGDFYLPFSVAADSSILMDAWISHLGKPW